jgi:hypothetical protein
MRGRVTATLLAAAAGVTLTAASLAVLGFTTAAPVRAGAAAHARAGGHARAAAWAFARHRGAVPPVPGGAAHLTAQQAGYVASGARFRYAQAIITVPVQPCRPGAGQPQLYVGLAGRSGYARAGVACQAAAGRWRAFVSLSRPGQATPTVRTFGLGPVRRGEGVFASVYFDQVTRRVRYFLTVPDGAGYGYLARAGGPGYGQAQALADWTGTAPAGPGPTAGRVLAARFLSGGFTTALGEQGTLEGPWALSRWEATGQGTHQLPGRLLAAPGFPRPDGTQRVIGPWADAFGVWWAR